jgi:hypothetical protein
LDLCFNFFASTWPSVILFLYHFAFYLIFLSLIAISEGTSLFSRGIAAQPELLLGPLHRHLSSAILHLLEHLFLLASQLLRLLKLFFFVRQSLPRLWLLLLLLIHLFYHLLISCTQLLLRSS